MDNIKKRIFKQKEAVLKGSLGLDFPTDGLISYWSMDERSPDDVTVYDTWGANNGTAVGAPTFSTANAVNGEGVGLNGTTQNINIGNNVANFVEEDFTVSVWLKVNSFSNNPCFLGNGAYQVAGYYIRVATDTGELQIEFARSGARSLIQTFDTISTGIWQHVVFAREGTVGTFYIKGNSVESYRQRDSIVNPVIGSSYPLRLGTNSQDSGTIALNGSIDEVAIWNRALTQEEVTTLYNQGRGTFYSA